MKLTSLACILLGSLALLLCLDQATGHAFNYCIIGAGPGGLQLGYYMEQAGLNYIILEKCSSVGCFFKKYPRHRVLISINKRHTQHKNEIFNERHDWNSLLNPSKNLLFGTYSKEFLPQADILLDYLDDFRRLYNIKVLFNHRVELIHKIDGDRFRLDLRVGYYPVPIYCNKVIMANGIAKTRRPASFSEDQYIDYSEMTIDPEFYEGKRVLILGGGNSAFETANHITAAAAAIILATKEPETPLTHQTHYVGHVRAINQAFLDTYQLKSLNIILNKVDADYIKLRNFRNGQFSVSNRYDLDLYGPIYRGAIHDTMKPFDYVLTCLGFLPDLDIYGDSAKPLMNKEKPKWHAMNKLFESANVPHMYFAGVHMHTTDINSSGGFIHGFRYHIENLFKHLMQKYEGLVWQHSVHDMKYFSYHLLKRINIAAASYQMFHYLGDVAIRKASSPNEYTYINDFPLPLLPQLDSVTGIKIAPNDEILTFHFDYASNYSCIGCNTLHEDRVIIDGDRPDLANFIHPIYHYYKTYSQIQKNGVNDFNIDWGMTDDVNTQWLKYDVYVENHFKLMDDWMGWCAKPKKYSRRCFNGMLQGEIQEGCSKIQRYLLPIV